MHTECSWARASWIMGIPGPAWTANPGGKAQEPENPRTRSQDANFVPLARVLRYAFCMSQPPSVLTAPRLWDLVADGYSREIAPHLAKYADDALPPGLNTFR
jgi:hypothetical protein